MLPKCLKCSNRLSLGWFLGSFIWTKNRCVNCGALHEFTNWHRLSGVLSVLAIVVGMPLLESSISWSLGRFLIICLAIFPIISIIPGQHRLDSKDKFGAKQT